MARNYYKGEEPVPGYKLIQPLGRGGFGEVWKANGPGGIPVALKIIGLTGKQGFKELRAIQRVKLIRHPNLVPITAFWLKDRAGNILDESITEGAEAQSAAAGHGTTFTPGEARAVQAAELIMAMGLGDKSLFDRLEECTRAGLPGIPPDELLGYMEDSARAIDHLNSPRHDLGAGLVSIQHCDIKPQNVMIVGGAAQVCDFGLARVLGDVRSTSAAMSPAYAAPECLKNNKPSEFTDQYSLAISYYELRTGVLPFDHDSYMGVVNAHLQGTLDLSKLPEAERAVIHRATAIDPKDRYPTTLAMVRALRQAYEGTTASGSVHKPTGQGVVEAGCELVPGYKLQRLIVRSGHDEVWESSAPGGKPVALVVRRLIGPVSSEDFVALDLLRGLEHDHLTEPHAYWLLDSRGDVVPDEKRDRPDAPPLSMLVIGGKLARKTLRDRLDECNQAGRTSIPVGELIGYIQQLASAVDYLNAPNHELGGHTLAIYHRDIRPVNLVLQGTSVRLGNCSLARVAGSPSFRVHSDGTGLDANYAAPEADGGEVTRWSDQYSLAIVYYHLRTGRLPFDTSRSSDETKVHRHGQLDLSGLSLPERAVIARATQLIPDQRYPSCTEMVAELSEACGIAVGVAAASDRHGPETALPPGAPVSQTIVPEARTTSPSPFESVSGEAAPLRGTMVAQTLEIPVHRDTRPSPITQTPVDSSVELEAARRSAAPRQVEPEYAVATPAVPQRRTMRRVAIVAVMLAGVAILGFVGTRGLFTRKPDGGFPAEKPSSTTGPARTAITKPTTGKAEQPISASTSKVKQEIAQLIDRELFGDALRVIRDNAAALGDDAAKLQEEVFAGWNKKAESELGAHAYREAAATSDQLIQAAPERIAGYLRLADVSMADDSAAPIEQTLQRFWQAPRAAADQDDFIAKLSEMQVRWIQRRVQQPAKPDDFAALAHQIARAEASAPQATNGWLLAAKAECLMEANNAKPTPKDLAEARAAVANSRVREAGGYGQYVTALVAHGAKEPDAAVADLLKIPSDDSTLAPGQTLRRARAVRILSDAANRLRAMGTTPQSELLRLDTADNPFGTPGNADTVFRCLARASELATDPNNPLPLSLRVNQALAAWYKPERDPVTMRDLTNRLLEEPMRSGLGAAAVPILIMNINVIDDNDAKLDRYATILDVADKRKPDEEFPPLDVYEVVIEPALKLGEDLAKHGVLGSTRQKRLAQVYAAKGQLILQNRYAPWPFTDKAQESVNAFTKAIEFDDTQAESFAGRAMAFSRLARPDLGAVERDARKAIELDEQRASGHGMLGYALLLQSRREARLRSKTKKLNDVIEALDVAIDRCEKAGDPARELPGYLTNRSVAYLELGNYESDRGKRKTHFEQAEKDAILASEKNQRYPEYAWAALGNALEAMAYVLGEKEKYEPSLQQFAKAVAERGDLAKSWLDQGRCRFKRAAAFQDRAELDAAIADLEKATGLDPSLAEPDFWLGRAYAYSRDLKKSDDSYRRALERAEENPTVWAIYAEDWWSSLLGEVLAGIRKAPPDAIQVQRLRDFRAWAESHKDRPSSSLTVSWLVGQTHEAEANHRAALKEYDAALPPDLATTDPQHVKLLLARSVVRFGSNSLWAEDVKRYDAADGQTPRPVQAILDADRAAALSEDDPATQAKALTLAAAERTALANERRGRPNELELREQAVRQLEAAISAAPTDPDCWRRRERLAIYVKGVVSDSNLNVSPAQRAKYRDEAAAHLELALQAREPTRDDRERLEKLKAEIRPR